jgi:hypothetical protein
MNPYGGLCHDRTLSGSDTGTPADDKDYQVPFRFTGKLKELTIKVEPPKLTEADIKALEKAMLQKD